MTVADEKVDAGDARRRAIEALWSDLEDLRQRHDQERLRRNERPVQKKELAEAMGVSPSTFGDWWNKQTVVPGWYETEKLVRALHGQPDAVRPRWRQAMNAYHSRPAATPVPASSRPADVDADPAADEPRGAGHEERQAPVAGPMNDLDRTRPRSRRLLPAFLGVLLLLGTATGVYELARSRAERPASEASVWQATVVRTWSTSRKMDIGIRPYIDPRQVERVYPGYHTGDVVPVTCYDTQGRVVTDADSGEQSSLWYQMNDDRGVWLPALFLQFDNRPGTAPPEGMSPCPQ